MNTVGEQFQAAEAAITHVLQRIRSSPEVGYYMGFGTESFSRLCAAYAAMSDESVEAVMDRFHPRNAKDPIAAAKREVEELEAELADAEGRVSRECSQDQRLYGPHALTAPQFIERIRELFLLCGTNPEAFVREVAALYDLQQVSYPVIALL